jgi:hypothetical protein
MPRIIVPFFATFTALLSISGPNAQAQQLNSRMQDTAMAAAAGPEFQRTGFMTVGKPVPRVSRPHLFPPNKYQSAMMRPSDDSDAYVPPIPKTNVGKTPSSLNLSGDDDIRAPQPDPGAYSPQIEARAWRMFPSADQNEERERWMAEQEQRAIANDINRTKPLMYPVSGR